MRDVSATSIVSAQSRQILNPSYHIKGSKQMKKTMKAVARFQEANGVGVGYLGGTAWYYLLV